MGSNKMAFLFEKIEHTKDIVGISKEVPEYITKGLSSKITLRDYQIRALENFLIYAEGPMSKNKQIWNLFHMATGSGKTVIIATLILYYFNKGYRNFLFFVRNINIIEKTIENLTNQASEKYLFANPLQINGKNIEIKRVNNFQYVNPDAINICFTSNAGLQNSLGLHPSENTLSKNDFEDNKVVMIADESHHLNAKTKDGQFYFDDEEDSSWESTTMSAFRANKDNVLLEFTATCDLKNSYVEHKYKDVIVFDYPLSKFREEKYSKDIISLPSTDNLTKRIIIALLISQYRYKLFQANNYNIKPVVMIKSKSIRESNENYEKYKKFINNKLNVQYLLEIKNDNDNIQIINQMFDFFDENKITLESLIAELKLEFSEDHSIILDSRNKKITKEDAKLLNSLEDVNNPYRLIFVVDMLNEGWDVLNLFDIVRLYDTRDGKWINRGRTYQPGKTTVSEMQLIGRGARYFPFKIESWQEYNKRKFDNQIDNPLRLCETLIYHCTTDSRYITEIKSVLKETGLVARTEPTKIELKVKDSFKAEKFYRLGYILTNSRIEKSRSDVKELPRKLRAIPIEYSITPHISAFVALFGENEIKFEKKKHLNIKVKEIPLNVLFKGIRTFTILSFDKLKIKFPNLKSIKEFILDDNYLGNMELLLTFPDNYNLTNVDLLNAYLKLLNEVATFISKIEVQYEGTTRFKEMPVKDLVKDIVTFREILPGTKQGEGVPQSIDNSHQFDLSHEDWYVYNENFGTSEEKSFVKYFAGMVERFKKKYRKVFLIRNEQQLGIYSFKTGERFEPDYILVLGNDDPGIKTLFYQIFIEPKGSQFLGSDGTFETGKEGWKQSLLKEIVDKKIEHEIFHDSSVYKIWGLPFYNEENTISEFSDELNKLI